MYAVIFRAKVASFDQEYSELAAQLRDLALSNYGCLDFIAVTEGEQEIAISYWPDTEHIRQWKADPLHQMAQSKGIKKWYQHYLIQIVKIEHEYQMGDLS